MSMLRSWSATVEEILGQKSQLASLFTQRGLIGQARENYLLEVLTDFLPTTLFVGQGQVFDADGGSSKQVDIVIARGDSVRLPLTEAKSYAFPIESSVATVEVKSHLTRSTLAQAFRIIESVYNLSIVATLPDPRSSERAARGDPLTEEEVRQYPTPLLRPANYIYAYDTTLGIDTFPGALLDAAAETELRAEHFPDVVATPGIVAIRNDNTIIPSDAYTEYEWLLAYREEPHPLYWILSHLLYRVTMLLGGSDVFGGTARLHIERHLAELPKEGWNIIRDPRTL